MDKRLYLSDTDKKIAGVCGGIAEYFGIDSTLIRLGWVFLLLPTAFIGGIVMYFLAAAIIPHRPPEGM
ncbi:PspC domain-containing protein [Gudongella oleilytica]|jgi:phage shock protein PspC (stress-responsive transcriptional regulator)|uniref:PspC domain-containing protein n=1 Tax=Gudongella oleilytica TaxID=1582259 RepID=UPI000FF8B6E2|nr:PspC domain-containing protein [Gudongella oleilytica]MDY0256440.1 PspC domain-containing protein [Gudongella oleilytica]